MSKGATCSVTVTGAGGLDPADLHSATPLSPVFNLTVRINNAHEWFSTACVGGFATATVRYGDALLGKGSMPHFCAGKRKVRERGGIRVWASGVDLPRFQRDQMAGDMVAREAAVDVEVMIPDQGCYHHCIDMLLTCSQAKIGEGPALCKEQKNPSPSLSRASGRLYRLSLLPTGANTSC